MTFIAANPGHTYSSILRMFPLPEGTLRYHLRRLEKEGAVIRRSESGRTRFYPIATTRGASGLKRPLSKSQQRIWDIVVKRPGATMKEIRLSTKMSRPSIRYQIDRMIESRLVWSEKVSGRKHFYPYDPKLKRYQIELKTLISSFLHDELDDEAFDRKKRELQKRHGV